MTGDGRSRVEALEERFGDPWAPESALPHATVLRADERAETCVEGERILDEYGFNAEFVPTVHGGRLARLDELIELTRVVCRRDPGLALGYGLSSFIAGANVWAAGRPDQCRRVAELLLGNHRVASVYHELEHGNDFSRIELTALPDGNGRLLVNGRKEIVTNVARASALVLLARTATEPGSRSLSQVLVDRAVVPPDTMKDLGRYPSVGMRGVQLGGVEFRDCPVDETAVLGPAGHGVEVALRSFQITRACLPAMLVGALDTAIRTALRFATGRTLYGRTVDALPTVRATLVDVFTDLLVADAMGLVTARAIHLLPEETSVAASASKFFVGGRAIDAMNRLSLLLGAHFYVRDGEYGIFQKLLRDVPPAGFGHAARVACLMTMLPQLPILARRAWVREPPAVPEQLYRRGAPLPPLSFDRLTVRTGGRDTLAGALARGREAVADSGDPALCRLTEAFGAELADVAAQCGQLRPADLGPGARPEALALAARYATVLAAAACLNVWAHERDDAFLGDPGWLVVALHRLARDAGLPVAADPAPVAARRPLLYAELAARFADGRSFDLANRPLRA
ncbi:acyl-CoA dehydrogenase [Plantactinospora sp. BB1]|uniref:acyl-CoA dehydrogenase n=1 Tax=Plantactinospora sp. BB1 TaxID=2071627 RepID=UPI00131F2442|nr:acyl-CoA dehydrogenase [Plantactinospora sp. BB1]